MVVQSNKFLYPLILIIDDDPCIADYLSTTFELKNYKIETALDGETGISKVEKLRPDLILLDLGLPRMDGREVCKILKSRSSTKYIPIIVITASTSHQTNEECTELGADEFITKPFDNTLLLTRVKAMLRIKSLEDELLEANKHLSSRIEEKTEALESLYMQTVKSLASVIDAKDHYTHFHSSRVTEYSVMIAKELGLSESEKVALRDAAELHDLGKVSVPDNILSKNGRLTDEEWVHVKKHAVVGAEILKPLFFLNGTIDAIQLHHEKFDGSGYPFGKRGKEIPLAARIIAVADAYEAMTSDRPYRKALRKEEAVIELKRNSGKQFDPEIVNTFLKILLTND